MSKAAANIPVDTRTSRAAAALYLAAFLSGAAALMYELTWAKMLSLTFGSTTLSAAAVIAAFMGGMGLGARYFHLVGERIRRPLAAYAGLEIGIAVSAAVLTPLFYQLPEVFARISATISSPPLFRAVQFVSVFVLVLVPSLLMGATFPALCAAMIRSAGAVDRRLGWIYGVNTVGGAVGVLVGGLVLIDRLGLTPTVFVGNAANLIAGAIALSLAKGQAASAAAIKDEATAIPTLLPRYLTGVVLFLSGFTTLAYEILWFRALRFIVGNSTHALGTVLVVFLMGLGLGSLLLRWAVRRSPERNLAFVQMGIAVFALWAMVCESLILAHPSVQPHVSIFLAEVRLQPWGWRLLIITGVSLLTMLPATVLMGLSFPLTTRLFLGDVRNLGTRVGTAYLLANVGSILGAIAGAALLVPLLGPTVGTKACAGVNLLVGLSLLVQLPGVRMGWAAVPVICTLALATILPRGIGLTGEGAPGDLIFEEDADQGTVHVFQSPTDPTQLAMLVDGCKIGCSIGYRTTPMFLKQTVLAQLPMALDANIQQTLNVGLGSGSTLHTLAKYPQLTSLDCVEINPAVVEGAHLFPEAEVYDDPRVHVVVDDAVSYLLRTPKDYDLIISDGKQDPFFSGNATLLSREYYQFARGSMKPGGLFVQWISLATLAEDFRIILATLIDVFPEVEVFVFAPDDAFLVASDQPIFGRIPSGDAESTRSREPAAGIYAELSRFGVSSRDALLARWVGGKSEYQAALANTPISTWDHLALDYTPFKADPALWSASRLENLRLLQGAAAGGAGPRVPSDVDPARNAFAKSQPLLRRAYVESLRGNLAEAHRLAQLAAESSPADVAAQQAEAVFSKQLSQRKP